jgi:hypothetical protein
MFADAADAAVETISARSGNFRRISTPLWTVCRDLENATGELVHADRLVSLGILAQELVQLRAD